MVVMASWIGIPRMQIYLCSALSITQYPDPYGYTLWRNPRTSPGPSSKPHCPTSRTPPGPSLHPNRWRSPVSPDYFYPRLHHLLVFVLRSAVFLAQSVLITYPRHRTTDGIQTLSCSAESSKAVQAVKRLPYTKARRVAREASAKQVQVESLKHPSYSAQVKPNPDQLLG
jgi:hypothetical protein